MTLTKATYSLINGAVVNVLDYGADPTGVADSTAAIQAALTYAGTLSIADPSFGGAGYFIKGGTTVFLPAGVYKTNATLTVPQNVSIEGAGKYASIIKSTASTYIIRIDDAVPAVGAYDKGGMAFRNFSLIGDRTLTNQVGFGLLRWAFNIMENVTVTKCGNNGIVMFQGLGNTFINVECIYNVGHGFVLQEGITSWATPTSNGLPSNANQFFSYHGMQNDGAGLYLGVGTNGNVFYSAVCESNYLASGNNVGYNVYSVSTSIVPDAFYGLWTEGPVEAHVYMNAPSAAIVLKIDQWRHFGNGAAGNVNRALIVNSGTVQLSNAFGQADSYKSISGSTAPFSLNKASGIICLDNVAGSLTTGVGFVDNGAGVKTGLENNLFQNNFGVIYNTQRVYQASNQLYHQAWYNDTQTEPFTAVSGSRNGLVFGDGTAAPTIVVRSGTGTPEGVVTAPVGSLFLRSDGGASTTLYVKQSGTGNTGWVGK
jgi:hypothetical protein